MHVAGRRRKRSLTRINHEGWPGSAGGPGRIETLDLVEPVVNARPTRTSWLVAAAIVVLLALCGVGGLIVYGGRNDSRTADQPRNPHQIAAQALVHADLASFPRLPGSTPLADPPSQLTGAHLFPSGERLVSETNYWKAPGTITQAARWFLAHKPAAFTNGGSGSEKINGILDSVDQRYDHSPVNLRKQRVVSLEIVQLDDGVAVRLTAWADWTP